jgi:tryptophanyl-tRNA synthetase
MDLQLPTSKMSKSLDSPQGIVYVLDPPEVVEKKFKRAVTDSETEVRYDPETKPGVSNLLSILAACTGRSPEEVAGGFERYGDLKAATAAAVIEVLRPIQARYRDLDEDPSRVRDLLAEGARRARTIADPVIERARAAVGLTPRT